jgi:hypothetical protein
MSGDRRSCLDCGTVAARRESVFCTVCGARLPDGRRAWWARRSTWWTLFVACVVLAAVALVRVPASLATDPREPVEELAAALEGRDTERLLAMMDFDASEAESFSWLRAPESSGLLGPDALSEGYEPPVVRLGETKETYDPETGDIGQTRGPQPQSTLMTFDEDWTVPVWTSRADTGWVRNWELRSTTARSAVLGRISLPIRQPIGPLVIAGVRFEPIDYSRSLRPKNQADVLVGTYTVTYEHPLFDPVPETAVVRSDTTTELTFPVGPVRAGVKEEIDTQIRAHLESCAEEATVLRPVGCALHHDPGHYFPLRGDARWEVESMPEVALEATDTVHETHRPTITVTTTSPGKALVTYAVMDGEERTVTVDIVVGGNVELDDSGQPDWRP